MIINAYAAREAKGALEPFQYELGEIGSDEVDIAVETCGICHSDLSMLDDEWGMAQYPLVPGHEVIGKVSAVGPHVRHLAAGDRVGLGWHAGYCMECEQCLGGDHNLCAASQPTIAGRHGGFADKVRAKAASAVKIPGGLAAAEAGPLLCGGIAVFNPIVQSGIDPTASVGVIGIGGLGHLALKFAKAWGCHVTAFTSESKMEEAKKMGAHDAIDSRDADAIRKVAGRFDLVISTVNVPMDWNSVLATLKPRGQLHMPGAVTEPLNISVMAMMFNQVSVTSSPVGAPVTIGKMLDFAARHNVVPINEHFPMSKVNEAFDHLREGAARYRIVLDRD